MNEEKLRILRLLEEGKVSAEEAARLMEALDKSEKKPSPRELKRKWLHIKVEKEGEKSVDVRIPLALLKFGFKFAPKHARFAMSEALSSEHRQRIREIKAKAKEARRRARREAREHIREARRMHGDAKGMNGLEEAIESAVEEAMEESFRDMGDLFSGAGTGAFDLDLSQILEMAQDPEFDGRILDVHDDDDDEHVSIRLE